MECKTFKRQVKADQRNLLLFSYLLLTFVQSLTHSLSVSVVIWVPLRNVRIVSTQCEWAWYWLSGRTYTIYIVTNIQACARHTNFTT